MKKKKIRFNYLTLPKFQLSLIGIYILNLVLILGFVLYQLDTIFSYLKMSGTRSGLNSEHPFFQLISHQQTLFLSNLALIFVISIILSSFVILIYSHKLAGPLIRIKIFFSELAKTGKLQKISFRKGDYLIEYAPIINEALEKIKPENKN